MIIYGYRNREIELGTGQFHCAKCEIQRPYRHKKIVRYFTLFFIPLFPLGKLSEYVECQVCGRTYQPEILLSASSTSTPISETDRYISSTQNNFEGTQPTAKKSSCLPIILLILGILSILGGGLMGIALIFTQSDPATGTGIGSFILAILLCPFPLVVLGLITIGAAIFLFRQKQDFS